MYYLLNYTWGLFTTLIGWIVYIVLMPFARDRGRYKKAHYLVIGSTHWGGFSLGVCFFVSNHQATMKIHEYGHTWQNAYYGILMPFLVLIPSVLRYWYKSLISHNWDNYYDIWYEKQATEWGKSKR